MMAFPIVHPLKGVMKMKKILAATVALAMCAPAFAGRPDGRYGGYYSDYNAPRYETHRHGGSRTAGTIAALLGGAILGAALASSSKSNRRVEKVTTYVTPAPTYAVPAYVEPADQSTCFDRQITEPTASGRYVTYTETICR
jgi:hypothetical protein